MTEFKIIAKTFQGLEEVLAKELINLGANNVEIGRRMVAFTGDKEMLYKANFCTRTAVKVLKPIKEFKATDADEVYEETKKIDWEKYMDVKSTFLVDSVIFSENFRHSKFVAYRVKDAIADYWREKSGGDRPNVVISNPDLRVNVHIAEDEVTISLDSSGESLHQRGYKTATVQAPLNEVLAAGLIMLTGWDGECDLIDPFCGSPSSLRQRSLLRTSIQVCSARSMPSRSGRTSMLTSSTASTTMTARSVNLTIKSTATTSTVKRCRLPQIMC